MTAPIDPRPYAAPTDLVTAADVLAWLVAIPPCPYDEAGAWDETDLANELTLRLDRERRQACRRGALACWRAFAGEARENRHPRYRDAYTALVWGDKPTDLYRIGEIARANLTRALAFRAAARQQ